MDATCPLDNQNRRQPLFKVQLPGEIVLGDGKSDNQNHSIIFTRGEFVQLIDANQDHYFEETLKIRNMLSEFTAQSTDTSPHSTLAILGARNILPMLIHSGEWVFVMR